MVVIAGPGPVLAMGAGWWLALALAGLRATGAVGPCIGVAMALVLLVFADPAGLLLALIAPLALLLAAPPLMISRSVGGLLLLLLFPLGFGLLGFAHVSATHGMGALHALAALRDDPLRLALPPSAPLAAMVLVAVPALVALPLLFWRSAPLRQIGAALLLLAMAPALLAVVFGAPLPATSLAAPAIGMGAGAAMLVLRRGGPRRPKQTATCLRGCCCARTGAAAATSAEAAA